MAESLDGVGESRALDEAEGAGEGDGEGFPGTGVLAAFSASSAAVRSRRDVTWRFVNRHQKNEEGRHAQAAIRSSSTLWYEAFSLSSRSCSASRYSSRQEVVMVFMIWCEKDWV